jgi:hypothetical protein
MAFFDRTPLKANRNAAMRYIATPTTSRPLSRVPPGWLALAVLGLLLYGAIALATHLGR